MFTRRSTGRTAVAGFSLVELMIILAIVNILAAIFIPGYLTTIARANVAGCVSELTTMRKFEAMYYLDYGRYADNLMDLSEIGNIEGYAEADFCYIEDMSRFRKANVTADGKSYEIRVTIQGVWFGDCWLTATPDGISYEGPCRGP
ncbi:MAG: prepilin-type N-terminal cleavage/methylation domain-containing protein [bacterium]